MQIEKLSINTTQTTYKAKNIGLKKQYNIAKKYYSPTDTGMLTTLCNGVKEAIGFLKGVYEYIIKDPFTPLYQKGMERDLSVKYFQDMGEDKLKKIYKASKNKNVENYKRVLKSCGIKEQDIAKFVSGEYFVTDAITGKPTLMHNNEKDPISIKLRKLNNDELKKLKILYPEDNSHYFV